MKKFLSRKLLVAVVAGIVVIVRPEVALYATIIACAHIGAQAWVDRKK